MYPLGKLIVGKTGELGSTFDHTQVHQLVKSRSKEQRLGIVLEGQGRKDYMFESLQVCWWEGLLADHVMQHVMHCLGQRTLLSIDSADSEQEQRKCCSGFLITVYWHLEHGWAWLKWVWLCTCDAVVL